MIENSPLIASLKPLFAPGSVAIIGASSTPFKQGNVAVKYLVSCGYEGDIYLINPSGGEIEGLKVYNSILDVPGEVDCALFIIPASITNETLRACAKKGVRAAIIGSNGFAELGTEEGRARQAELAEIARANGIRILGPNTNGIWNVSAKFSLGYNTSHGDPMTPGPVAIVAHSGALFNSIAPALRGFGTCLSKFVPAGNEADTGMLDYLEYFIADDDTKVIGLIVEGVRDGARLRELAMRARSAGKPIIALKLGRSQAGAGAALAHSSRLAGSARAYEALFRACGIAQVPSIESLAGACALLAKGFPQSRAVNADLVAVSTSGGGAELVADHAEEWGIKLAGEADGSWDGEAAKVIASFTGAGLVRNPVDGGNLAGWPRLEEIFLAAERDGRTGPVLYFAHMLPREHSDRQVAEILVRRQKRTGSPLVCVSPGGLRESICAYFRDEHVPVFSDLGTCFDALRCYYDAVEFESVSGSIPRLTREQSAEVLACINSAGAHTLLTEIESADILRIAGVPLVESTRVKTLAEAQARLIAPGSRVVLKGIVPGIAHKNDAGLVMTGIGDAVQLAAAYAKIEQSILTTGVDRNEVVLIVQDMLASRAELIAGVSFEPQLGHFLVVGLGGIYAEALDEVKLFTIPSSPAALAAGLFNTRLGAVLRRLDDTAANGFSPSEAIIKVLCALQALVLECPARIRSIDVNPLLAGADHCTAVDALIELCD